MAAVIPSRGLVRGRAGRPVGPIRDELGGAVGDISLAITAYGIAAACMAPVVGSLADRFGLVAIDQCRWSSAFPLPALLPFGLALQVVCLLFREPRPEQRPQQASGRRELTGRAPAEVLRDHRSWLIFASVLLIALAYGGIVVHPQQILELNGFAKPLARDVVSSPAVAILVGRVGTGFLLDRFWAPLVTLPILRLPALACVRLAGRA